MKFGQLIEYNMRNIFLKISFTKCGRETISRPFSKRSYVMSGSIFLKFIVYIYSMPSWRMSKCIETEW